MSNMIEAQGVTVDEAIQLALNQLGVGRDRVEIKILHHPRSGFLGIGARRAKVRATVREDSLQDGAEFDMSEGRRNRRRRRRPPRHRRGSEEDVAASGDGAGREKRNGDNRRDPGRGAGRESSGRENSPRDAAKTGEGDQRSSGTRSRGNRRGGRGRQGRGRNEQTESGSEAGERTERASGVQGAQAGPAGNRERSSSGRGRGRGRDQQRAPGRPRESGDEGAPADATPAPANVGVNETIAATSSAAATYMPVDVSARAESAPVDTSVESLPLEEIRPRAEEIISEILRLMGFEAKVSATCDEDADEVVVVVEADAEGLLIGRRGQTLDAFEHLVNRSVAAREMAENRVIIDVGGYRNRRRESLLELAGRLRERAMSEGRRVQVSPMSPRDRKVFQDAFAGDEEVTTRALGTGFYRRVLIVPEGADDREPVGDGDDQSQLGEPTE